MDVAEWTEDNESWLRRYLALAHGTPSHDTFGWVFRAIAAIKALLDTLTLKGCIVTIDAIGCQTGIAQKIIDRGGDYLLAVKDKQGKLADALREFFAEADTGGFGAMPVSRSETVEKDHGRIETRSGLWVSDLVWLDRDIRRHWPKLAGVGMMERRREINGKTSVERAFYLGAEAGGWGAMETRLTFMIGGVANAS